LDDILTILVSVSGIAAPFVDFYYWGFMSLRFAQLASVLGTVGKMRWKIFSGLVAQMVVMIAFFISLIFSITGLVFNYENVYFTSGALTNYFVAFYMCGITLTTVGYGDFSPLSRPGRVVIILGLLAAFWMLPPLIAAVLEPWRKYRANRNYGGTGHAIILSQSEDVQTVVDQFYRAKKTIAENLLLMTPKKESSALRTFLKQEFLRLRVTHFEGNFCDFKVVQRTIPGQAHFCLLVQNKYSDDAELSDASLIGGALAVLRVSKNLPLFIQLNSASRRFAFDHNLENIICMEDLRRGLLVQNCTAPGILSVLSNLIISKAGTPKRHRKGWLAPYKNGLYAKFETDISLAPVAGNSYANVCKAMRALFSITLVSIWSPNKGVTLFPLRHIIEPEDIGQFIFDKGRNTLVRNLESEELQKYLVMLKASTNFDDVDHMKALSLADMIDSEDAQLVKQFNLFQRSNLSDLLARTQSSIDSESLKERRSVSEMHSSNMRHHEEHSKSAEEPLHRVESHAEVFAPHRSPTSSPEDSDECKSNSDPSDEISSSSSSSIRGEAPVIDVEAEEVRVESPRKSPSGKAAKSSEAAEISEDHHGPKLRDVWERSQGHATQDIPLASAESPGEPSKSHLADPMFAMHAAISDQSQADPFIAPMIGPSLMISQDDLEDEIATSTWDQATAKRSSLEGKVSNHIIVCGKADEMTTSIVKRLYRRTPEDQDIVLLVNQVSEASQKIIDQLNILSSIDRIYILIGQSMSPSDLSRAGAISARVCLVLPDRPNLSDPSVQAAQDSNMLITYHLLDQTDVFPIVELMNPENEALMSDDSEETSKLGTARGCVFKRSLFDNILTQSVFKPHLIPLFEQLSDAVVAHVAVKRFWDELSASGDDSGNILFGQVFSFILERKNCLSIAVYRKRRDAEDQWLAKQNAKRKNPPKYVVEAGRAFRESKKPHSQHMSHRALHRLSAEFHHLQEPQKGEIEKKDLRIAINSPDSNMVMIRSDLIIVIDYLTNTKLSATLASLPGSPMTQRYQENFE
jgi:voltage-gated potassium channel